MDRIRESEQYDDVNDQDFNLERDREQRMHALDEDESPTRIWDARDDMSEEPPQYDSRAGA